MSFTEEQIGLLKAPLSKAHVKKNPRGFDYVEGWHAIAEANRVFGFDNWNRETLEMRLLGEPEIVGSNWRVAYHCRCRVTVWDGEKYITRDGSGFGSGIVKDVRDAHESAIKEAETDAMKRALMTFGNPFGLALYDKEQANVEAAPKPQTPAPLTGTDADKATQFIIATMEGLTTPQQMDEFGASADFKSAWGRLPTTHRNQITIAGREHRSKLTAKEAA